jgi:peptide/nickel transport system substrate-binding protein
MMRPRRQFRLALRALLLVSAGCAAGCGKQPPAEVRVAVIGTGPLDLGDPLAPPATEAQATLRLAVAQGLVRFDAAGQVESGLAERWNVSDDGLSYIFRLAAGEWPDGRKIMARDVARILTRQIRSNRDQPTREALGAVAEVVAMTDRVIEIRLDAPRPNLLQLLAQPEFALIREGIGSGPFVPADPRDDDKPRKDEASLGPGATVWLTRRTRGIDGEAGTRENISLTALPAARAITAFAAQRIDLVLGGTIADLPLARRVKLDRGTLRFDPAAGLFGLVPARRTSPLAEPDVRHLLSEAIDRDALIGALRVPGLGPRATLLDAGLDGLADPAQPEWMARPLAERRPDLTAEAQRLFGETDRPSLSVALPDGPGGDLIFARLFADWGAIGIGVERAVPGRPADLRLVDAVAPSSSPAWYLRQFRCAVAPICVEPADELLQAAREAPVAAQRAALFAQVATLFDEAALFIPLAAPVRWSLVGDRVNAFQENRFARHPLTGIALAAPSRGFAQ